MEPSNKYCLSTNGSMEKQGQYINHIQPTQESNKVLCFWSCSWEGWTRKWPLYP